MAISVVTADSSIDTFEAGIILIKQVLMCLVSLDCFGSKNEY